MKKVSIILPTFNGSKYIKSAINSVLAQSFQNWELLVIDDGSTDDTSRIISDYSKKDPRIIYRRNESNLGIQKTLNRGLKESKSKYIARIDDDDQWCDVDKLKKQIDFLDNNKDYALVGTGAIVVDENQRELFRYLMPQSDKKIRQKILSKNCFVHSSVIFTREKAIYCGMYNEDETSKHVEDYELWLKLGIYDKLRNLPFYGVYFTLRQNNISSRNKIEQFRKDIKLSKKYKDKYPNYIKSLLNEYTRLILYRVFINIPISKLKNKILKIYKQK